VSNLRVVEHKDGDGAAVLVVVEQVERSGQ
jgi:hypothetical protein